MFYWNSLHIQERRDHNDSFFVTQISGIFNSYSSLTLSLSLSRSLTHSSQSSEAGGINLSVGGTQSGFEGSYKLRAVLGSGAFSTVREGVNKNTGDVTAVKIVTKKNLSAEDDVALQDEVGESLTQSSLALEEDENNEPLQN